MGDFFSKIKNKIDIYNLKKSIIKKQKTNTQQQKQIKSNSRIIYLEKPTGFDLNQQYNTKNNNDLTPEEEEKYQNIVKTIINEYYDFRYHNKQLNADIEDEKRQINSNSWDEARKMIKSEMNFNPMKLEPSWMSDFASYGKKYYLLYKQVNRNSAFICLTTQQHFLKSLYTSSVVMQEALKKTINLCFSELNIILKDKSKELNEKENKYFLKKIQDIIEYAELTGSCIVELTDKKELIIHEDMRYIDNEKENFFFVASSNIPLGVLSYVKPGGLTYFENKMHLIETAEMIKNCRNEILARKVFLTLKVKDHNDDDTYEKLTEKQRQELQKKAESISRRGVESVITLPDGIDLQYHTSQVNIQEYNDAYYSTMQDITGIPVNIWRGEDTGAINIGNTNDKNNIMIDSLKERFRNHYDDFILKLAIAFFEKDNLNINYNDLTKAASVRKVTALKELSEIISTISTYNTDGDINEQVKDLSNKILNKINEQLED